MVINDLVIDVLNGAMLRDDRKATPLIISIGRLLEKGYDLGYCVECMKQYYDGRPIHDDYTLGYSVGGVFRR